MKINKEQQNQLAAKINQIWKGSKACVICSGDKWTVLDTMFEISEFSPLKEESKQVAPVVVLSCDNCGNTILFSAVKLGFSFNKGEDKPREIPII